MATAKELENMIEELKNPENWMKIYPSAIPPELQDKGMEEGAHLFIPKPDIVVSLQLFVNKCNDLKILAYLSEEIAKLREENPIDVFISVNTLLKIIDNKINKLKE